MLIDEKTRRKPTFDERSAVAVTFADGSLWYVPKPWLEVRPRFERGSARTSYPVYTCGPKLDLLLEAIDASEDIYTSVAAVATLAAELLCYHYDLADGELDQMLAFRPADSSSFDWARQTVEIATGRSGPKAASAGGA